MELLSMSGICKSFDAVPVLIDVSLGVKRGEIHALLGENGAGKSTLMNILTGSCAADAGRIMFDGADIAARSIKQIEQAGVAFVHQELNLFNDLTAYENIFLGQEETTPWGALRKSYMANKAIELFKRLDVDIDPFAMVSDLKPSEKQLLEISRALFFDAQLLILDEPTTALNTSEIGHLFSIVRGLRDQGISFIFISHKMPEIFELCDRYTVLRNGSFIGSGALDQTDPRALTMMMIGSSIADRGFYRSRPIGATVLELQHFSGRGFSDISLSVGQGQIVGFTGLKGCGSSELMQCLFGLMHQAAGKVVACGRQLQGGSIHEAMKAGLAMLPSDRKENSVIGDMTLMENMCLSEQVLSAVCFPISTRVETERFELYRKMLAIKAISGGENINDLSGGNQQKVFLARWLNTDPQVLLLDNPTQGIDVGAKAEIYRLILDLACAGRTVLINTVEIPELREVADVCYVFYEGAVVKQLEHDEINERTVMMYSTKAIAND